jgi:hypothetical protein
VNGKIGKHDCAKPGVGANTEVDHAGEKGDARKSTNKQWDRGGLTNNGHVPLAKEGPAYPSKTDDDNEDQGYTDAADSAASLAFSRFHAV